MSEAQASGQLCYLDASALVKLVVAEAESLALAAFLDHWSFQVSSVVVDVELHRAILRGPNTAKRLAKAREVVDGLGLVELEPGVVTIAREAGPSSLRTLDAIHLASALSIRDDLGALVAYDERLAEAARHAGLHVQTPA